MEYILVLMTLKGPVQTDVTGLTYQAHTVTISRHPSLNECRRVAKAAEALVPEQEYVTNGKATAAIKSRYTCVAAVVDAPSVVGN